jgi:hypothetical protein
MRTGRSTLGMATLVLLAVLATAGCTPGGAGARPSGLPSGFPDDVPVYAGTVVRAEAATVGGRAAFLVSLETPDDLATVHAWYEKELKAGGWTLSPGIAASTEAGYLAAAKGDMRASVTLMVGKDKTGKAITAIASSVSPQ